MLALADICRSAAAACPAFSDAAAMLRVWARQQQLSQGADGLSGPMLTLLLVHLLETGQAVSGCEGVLHAACTAASSGGAGTTKRMRKRDNLIPRDLTHFYIG